MSRKLAALRPETYLPFSLSREQQAEQRRAFAALLRSGRYEWKSGGGFHAIRETGTPDRPAQCKACAIFAFMHSLGFNIDNEDSVDIYSQFRRRTGIQSVEIWAQNDTGPRDGMSDEEWGKLIFERIATFAENYPTD